MNRNIIAFGNDQLDFFCPIWKCLAVVSYTLAQFFKAFRLGTIWKEMANDVNREQFVNYVEIALVPNLFALKTNEIFVTFQFSFHA